jgi:hypothetical protein
MISGKVFADKCKWVFDNRYPGRAIFDYNQSNHGDWVFINGDFLHRFVSILPIPHHTTKQFHIIVHNSDIPFGARELERLLPYSIRIYAINTTVKHERLKTIPLGFVDRQLDLIQGFKRPDVERDISIYANFSINTNTQKRLECIQTLPNPTIRKNLSVTDYYTDLCRSKFVACPEGTGIDTHRIYESLYFGATPVVLASNPLAWFYEKFPICIVNSWSDTYTVPKGKQISFDISTYLD